MVHLISTVPAASRSCGSIIGNAPSFWEAYPLEKYRYFIVFTSYHVIQFLADNPVPKAVIRIAIRMSCGMNHQCTGE